MEKTPGALQMMGKLLFSYSSELINLDLSKGLPPSLVADEPSLSFAMKRVDINMEAYLTELGWLTHSVTPHVQSVEMHNQPINSLALISVRCTTQAIECSRIYLPTDGNTIQDDAAEVFRWRVGHRVILGGSSKLLYRFVRKELNTPFHCGLVEHPTVKGDDVPNRPRKTIGSWISIIIDAIVDGRIQAPPRDAYTGTLQNGDAGKLRNGVGNVQKSETGRIKNRVDSRPV
ncbi:uncharacterized protein DFL_002864 [Arthrobotrys flagrans]|uniref:Uncharacterized protein n=1 Tax=Arthrobotrys flagrans TaxID=97331 RepID=A0A437AC80_ARTFL|nr:hypothetical protein DFL_002864 [Arthrobotrys flagrans]